MELPCVASLFTSASKILPFYHTTSNCNVCFIQLRLLLEGAAELQLSITDLCDDGDKDALWDNGKEVLDWK